MKRTKKITKEAIRAAIAKIKRRKGIHVDSDITITMIADELGCSRQMLYREEFNVILDKYKRIKKESESQESKRGTLAHYKYIALKKQKEIGKLEEDIKQAKDGLIDQEVLLSMIRELEAINTNLSENKEADKIIASQAKEINYLREENFRLRTKILSRVE